MSGTEKVRRKIWQEGRMNKLLLTFYGDDFTGSTDALEQLTLAGIRTALFIEPPTSALLKRFPNLQAIGIAGMTRSMNPAAMERELRPALKKLKAFGARHVHYKVCSTFDSSPTVGSIGRVIDIAMKIFHAPFVPLLVAAPALGRYTIFGTHFARFGIGSNGEIHRLDRHPSISKHPVTPMNEADLRLHLSKQTKKKIALFDILKVSLPEKESHAAFKQTLAGKPDVVLFDVLNTEHLARVGELIDEFASAKRPLFSIGSSGIEMALAATWKTKRLARTLAPPARQILVGSGSCSPITEKQIAWALKDGFAKVALGTEALASANNSDREIHRATKSTAKFLHAGRSVIVHTTRSGSDKRIAAKLKNNTAKILGTALGKVLRAALAQTKIKRLCIAGGDTSSYAARALGIEALEMIAPLTPGAPLCRAHAPGSPVDGHEIVFKGGQVGAENYFQTVLKGNS
jgi:3-oxoisoapionate kinase